MDADPLDQTRDPKHWFAPPPQPTPPTPTPRRWLVGLATAAALVGAYLVGHHGRAAGPERTVTTTACTDLSAAAGDLDDILGEVATITGGAIGAMQVGDTAKINEASSQIADLSVRKHAAELALHDSQRGCLGH